ncbi:hypothetical protein F0562_034640 [Nyssa sinensis]|uniref:Uncharacterized protein n=1 Tax=Nyssa sinensis TaxID=561372 RepID=A0A5J5A8L0_9ASTE|nr:hypothetical protein F0562_034640 [Nyssa sinensis]
MCHQHMRLYSFHPGRKTLPFLRLRTEAARERRNTKEPPTYLSRAIAAETVDRDRRCPLPTADCRPQRCSLSFAERMVETLFEDIFKVDRLDPDGKKFDKVSRIEARSEQFDMYMQLDVNTDIYPIHVGDKFMMVLAPTLDLDGTPDTGYYTQGGRKSLADKFEYVMHGKLYRISEEGSGPKVKADMYVSFGGLLMMLKGDPSIAAKFELDQRLFILMRKV